MNAKITKYILIDLLKSKFVISYAAILFLISTALMYFGSEPVKVTASMLNVVLYIVPLVCLIFGTIHFYNSREFMEFLLTQPVSRKTIFLSEFAALSLSLSAGFIAGAGLPMLFYGISAAGISLFVSGIVLTFIFVSLSLLSASLNKDKIRGMGTAIAVWLYMSVLFDAIVLLMFFAFREYPLEKALVITASLNPVDLSRILVLLQIDMTALMGFTGAAFQKFFGDTYGKIFSIVMMLAWTFVPFLLSYRIFRRKSF